MSTRRVTLRAMGAIACAHLLRAVGASAETREDTEWRKVLTPEQFRVLRKAGTELPGSSILNAEKRAGAYRYVFENVLTMLFGECSSFLLKKGSM